MILLTRAGWWASPRASCYSVSSCSSSILAPLTFAIVRVCSNGLPINLMFRGLRTFCTTATSCYMCFRRLFAAGDICGTPSSKSQKESSPKSGASTTALIWPLSAPELRAATACLISSGVEACVRTNLGQHLAHRSLS